MKNLTPINFTWSLNLLLLLFFTQANSSSFSKDTFILDDVSKNVEILSIKGTGQTTGHIATITVKNPTEEIKHTLPQTFYIPSDSKFQSYYGRIPDIHTIPPKTIQEIPIEGYCLDISKPPVALGESMASISDWVPIKQVFNPSEENYVTIVKDEALDRYETATFKRKINPDALSSVVGKNRYNIEVLYPGTDEVFPFVLEMKEDPDRIIPMIVEIVERIEEAADYIQEESITRTPMIGDKQREKEAIVQQTIWITMGALFGVPYEKGDFQDRLISQFEEKTNQQYHQLTKDDQEKLTAGVDDFWNTFTATGVEAKVLQGNGDANKQLISSRDDDCQCDTLTFTLSRLNSLGAFTPITTHSTTTFRASGSEDLEDVTLSKDEFESIELRVTNVKFVCSCQDSISCAYYNDNHIEEENRNKFEASTSLSRTANVGSIEEEENAGDEFNTTITTNDDFKNIYVYIRLKAYCMNEDCDRKTCIRKFQIQFLLEEEEE